MTSATPIRCFDYVNHSYEKVCEALAMNANDVFHQATRRAETRAESVAAGLHLNVAGVEIGKEILIDIKSYVDIESNGEQQMAVFLEWKAASTPSLFPTMIAQLHVYPITSTETQLDFNGEYKPPLGILGKAVNAVVGHRIADASVHRFVAEVADYLENKIE